MEIKKYFSNKIERNIHDWIMCYMHTCNKTYWREKMKLIIRTWEDSEIQMVQTQTDASHVQGSLFWWVGQKRSSWRNLERYITDTLYVILSSRLRCFHLIQNVGIRSVAWSKQCLEQLICLQDRFKGGETWVREDLRRICFIE